jgi:hypothetical protein
MSIIGPIILGVVVAGVVLLVWPCMEREWPVTPGAKVEVVARWAFLGIVLGCFAYVFLWQFMEPVGQPTGGAMAIVYLVTSPWAWGFLSLCALSAALVPVMAICRGTQTSYGRLLYFLGGVWALGLLITEPIAVLIYRAELREHYRDWSVVNLFTLSVPTALALVVLIAPSWRDER